MFFIYEFILINKWGIKIYIYNYIELINKITGVKNIKIAMLKKNPSRLGFFSQDSS